MAAFTPDLDRLKDLYDHYGAGLFALCFLQGGPARLYLEPDGVLPVPKRPPALSPGGWPAREERAFCGWAT